MAKSKSGDGFSVDFSSLFPDEATKQESAPKKTEKVEEKEEKSVEKRLEEQKEKEVQADSYTKTTETKAEEKENPVPVLKTEPLISNQSIPKSNESSPKEQLIYITIYLESEEDRAYLKFRSKELSLSVSEFLWQMIEQDDLTKIDVTDSLHEKFRSTRLPLSTSVKATAEEKRIMQLHAAKHRLLMTRFIGFLIQKNRLSDSAWENIG
jgi:hypothetical protein